MSAQPDTEGALFVVATPIGNLEDITLRALKVLAAVDLIACEDTRRSGILLKAHGIKKPLFSYFEHNEERRIPGLIERLREGAKIALISDAGTPTISDPGYRLVSAALDAGVRVEAIPGPSALTAAIAAAGLPTNRFAFEGFLPVREVARKKLLDELRAETRTMVFFESPRRLGQTLVEMAAAWGSERRAVVVREMTKAFEEAIRGSLDELMRRFKGAMVRGEVSLVVQGSGERSEESGRKAAVDVDTLLAAGLSLKQASTVVAMLEGRGRRAIYQENLKKARSGAQNEI